MLYQFTIALSDVDRSLYETLNFRLNQHPSETPAYLLTRTLAYLLSYQENLEFRAAGLGDPDSAALLAKTATGEIELWIEIGNPSAKKLHKASKSAQRVVVYTYKNPDPLLKELKENRVHRLEEIKLFALEPNFLESLSIELKKNCRWSLLQQDGQIDVGTPEKNYSSQVKEISLAGLL